MSCGSEFETESFITDTLLAIVEAQDRVDSGVGGLSVFREIRKKRIFRCSISKQKNGIHPLIYRKI